MREGELNRGEPTLEEQIAAAEVYAALFGPGEFEEWAPRVVAAARIQPGQRVVDVACGTGVLTREVARRVGVAGFVVGVDANPGMLAVAERTSSSASSADTGTSPAGAVASGADGARIEWRRAGAEALPYPDESFDAVVCQFGLMFFNRQVALREMMRVLVPGGHLTAAVWDTLDHTPAYAALVALLERRAGPRAADALRAPFALGDRNELAALFSRADMADVEIVTYRGTGRYPNVRSLVEAEVRGWLPAAGVPLTDAQVQEIVADAEDVLRPYVTSHDGAITFDAPAHIVTARKANPG